jgi:hypothetical protein
VQDRQRRHCRATAFFFFFFSFFFFHHTAFDLFAIMAYIHGILPPPGLNQPMRPLRSPPEKNKKGKTRRKTHSPLSCYRRRSGSLLPLLLPHACGSACLRLGVASAPANEDGDTHTPSPGYNIYRPRLGRRQQAPTSSPPSLSISSFPPSSISLPSQQSQHGEVLMSSRAVESVRS